MQRSFVDAASSSVLSDRVTWVIGRGGLLGSHVAAVVRVNGREWRPPAAIPWHQPDAADAALRGQVEAFLADAAGTDWRIAWCAGAGVVGTDAASLEREAARFRFLLAALREVAGKDVRGGALFVSSSAGGVYANAAPAPFSETTDARPLSPYGVSRLALEHTAQTWAADVGMPLVIGRIANLYGPGQDLTKQQGLISQLCRAQLTGSPLSVYVPLDTIRDYLFVDDCARLVVDCLDRLRRETSTTDTRMVVKVLATQRGVTIGAVVAEIGRVLRRRPRIVLGASPWAAHQARDLRLRSQVWTELDRRAFTTLPAGILATIEDLRRQLRGGLLDPTPS